jgi:hypothetical protein
VLNIQLTATDKHARREDATITMGVMLHLQSTAPTAGQIAICLVVVGIIAVAVDYARMLLLRQKMVRKECSQNNTLEFGH